MTLFIKIRSVLIIITMITILPAQAFSIARIHYDGGGDWYGDPSSLPNLLSYIQMNTSILVNDNEVRVKLTDSDLYSHSFLYITGHGNIRFSVDEVIDVSMIADSMIIQEYYTARSINIFNEIFSIEEDDDEDNK